VAELLGLPGKGRVALGDPDAEVTEGDDVDGPAVRPVRGRCVPRRSLARLP
jgi:hypothetical protein